MKIIMHNSISVDGSFVNLDVNMALHYQLLGQFRADAHLIGGRTAKIGLKMEGAKSKETAEDKVKPNKDPKLPYWVMFDPKGELKNLLHNYRRFNYCKDVIVIGSASTPNAYQKYLADRQYDFYAIGKDEVDLVKTVEFIEKQYKIKTAVTDTGRTLNNALLNNKLIDEISLLLTPQIVGKKAENLFTYIKDKNSLTLKHSEKISQNYLWLRYSVDK